MDDDYTEEIEPHERLIFGRPYVGEEGGPRRCDVTGEPFWVCECPVCAEERAVCRAEDDYDEDEYVPREEYIHRGDT